MPLNPETLMADPCLRTDENGKVTLHAAGLVWQRASSTNKYWKIGIAEMPVAFEVMLSSDVSLRLRLHLTEEILFAVLDYISLSAAVLLPLPEDFVTFSALAHATVEKARKVITTEIKMRQAALAALPVGE
jgi:hypothetical protein